MFQRTKICSGLLLAFGSSLLTIAPGFRYKFTEYLQMGLALEMPLLGNRDLFQYRIGLDLIWRYSGVLGAVEAKHRCIDFVCKIKSVLRHGRTRRIHEASIKGDTRLEARIMRRIEPHAPATPAKANDPEPARISTL